MSKILIIDDDIAIANLISDALEDEDFETVTMNDANSAYTYILDNGAEISLITLDIMMPEVSGIDLCKSIRNIVSCPIVFVSAKSKTIDAVLGLEIGDDYIAKPFVVEEFVARIKAHLRREKRKQPDPQKDIIKVGDIEINTGSYEVRKNGKLVSFSTREFQL